jgi:hypothetical protein
VAAVYIGAALGCSDPRRLAEAIAREEPAPLSLPADVRPGAGPDGPARAATPTRGSAKAEEEPEKRAATGPEAPPEGDDALDEGGDGAAEAQPGRRRAASPARGRRRRPAGGSDAPAERGGEANGADAGGAEPALGEAGQGVPELKVTRLVVARGVSGREPVGVATSFSAAEVERLYAFVALTNEARVASDVVVTFTPPGGGARGRSPARRGRGARGPSR